MDNEAKLELKRRIVVAKADVEERRASLLNDMDLIYQDPDGAARKVTGFVMKYGEKALIDKLDKDPAFFGGTKGHVGSKTFLKPAGFAERAVAKEVSKDLPVKAKALQDAENKLVDLQRAYHGGSPNFVSAMSREKGGPDR